MGENPPNLFLFSRGATIPTLWAMLVYIYICGFIMLYLQTAGLRLKKKTFANLLRTPPFIFRGVAAIHFCAVETHSNSRQMVSA